MLELFSIKDAIDIFLVALMLYYTYRFMRESRSINVFTGIIVFILIWLFVSRILEMRLLGAIFDKLVSVGALAILILFQDEIRKFLNNLGGHQRIRSIIRFFRSEEKKSASDKDVVMPIVMACQNMARGKVGALIVIERESSLDEIVRSGDLIDAKVNQRLIENIFFKNSPLHDGAMIVSHNRIKAAGCILPVSHDLDIPRDLGLRHRAAMGMSQESDAICVIVSEETGRVSVAIGGKFRLRLTAESLESLLNDEL